MPVGHSFGGHGGRLDDRLGITNERRGPQTESRGACLQETKIYQADFLESVRRQASRKRWCSMGAAGSQGI